MVTIFKATKMIQPIKFLYDFYCLFRITVFKNLKLRRKISDPVSEIPLSTLLCKKCTILRFHHKIIIVQINLQTSILRFHDLSFCSLLQTSILRFAIS